ncbi:alpha-1,6-mannosylglycoprotein 6-beta-N-acetylglucosaminyltransferase B [Pteropus vampyrus]|uniref:alpha-1,6-mannosyl-glycoprotein 6-beta-N-acetylglucosaminyltransferase n=1 Tax=Pteropus vampyrus TaxID=132908 RepID=A0A6P6CIY7_PTEVA|nr:alpha-1,6-mannosylglycoprotein 6-beta-N-acetylglucosaminyltransferase B [Pteropus vampyrus]
MGDLPAQELGLLTSHCPPTHPVLTHSFVRAPTASGRTPLTCPVALRRLFVLGIGFFSLCFLMTSLGGQFSARRPGDSPFTIRTEGILPTSSEDMLPPGAGLMERIQAIAQNVSDIAVKVDQILRHSLLLHSKVSEGRRDQCEAPSDPKFPDCAGKVEWMRARWTSDPCYAFFGVDGTECSFLTYLSEVEWFCPPLPGRNQTATQMAPKPLPKAQAVFRSNLSHLLELMGSGKESLTFMKKRTKRLTGQWALAAQRLAQKLGGIQRDQKQTLKDSSLSNLGVPPGRGNCPLTVPLPFDLIYTDYHGLQQMKQHMGLSFRKYRCRIRVIDTFGTEPAYNHEEYATLHGYRTNWGYWNLNPKQFMTMFPHTPDNSFMGFVSEELNDTEKQLIKGGKAGNMAVVYGKEASIWKLQGKEKSLGILSKYMEIHGTVYYESQRPPEVPAFVKNHGLLPQPEFQQLLRKAKLFIGFGFPYEGPAPLEAIANGCVFLQSRFSPPHSSLNHEFFRGKPTSREVFSQHPYAENFIGKPHVWTVDYNNSDEFEAAIKAIMRTQVRSGPSQDCPSPRTCRGPLPFLEKIHVAFLLQDFCAAPGPVPPGARAPQSPFVLAPNATHLEWAGNSSSVPGAWPPAHSLRAWLAAAGRACTDVCLDHGLVCEPSFFPMLNSQDAFRKLQVPCDSTESEMNHLYPAFAQPGQECFLQKEPLLFSCAGSSTKYRRLCPCRDFRKGQVALCQDCL